MTQKLQLLSFLFLALFYKVNSQTSWTVVEDGSIYTQIESIKVIPDEMVIIGTNFLGTCWCDGRIRAYDLKGKLIWSKDIWGNFLELSVLNDSIFVSSNGECSDTPSSDIRLQILDKQGDLLLDTAHGTHQSKYYGYMKYILPTKDKNVLMFSSKKGYPTYGCEGALLTKEGSLIKTALFNFRAEPTATELINDRSFAVFTDSLAYIINDSLELIDSVSLGDKILSVAKKDNLFYCLVNNNIIVLDSALQQIKSISFAQNGQFQQIKNSAGELVLSTQLDSSLQFSFLKADTFYETIKIDSSYQAKNFLWSSDKLFTTGKTKFGQGFFACHDTLLNENKPFSDIELLEVQVKNIESSYMGPTGTEYFSHYCADYEVLVKNTGNDTIHNFSVFADVGYYGICGSDDYDRIPFELLPGEEKWVTGNKLCAGSKKVEFCMELVAPNSSYEKNTSNNEICGYYGDVGVEKIIESNIHIYPNPFRETLTISQEELNFTAYQILASQGKLIKTGVLNETVQLIEIADLTTGFYYLNLNSEERTQFFKLQKL